MKPVLTQECFRMHRTVGWLAALAAVVASGLVAVRGPGLSGVSLATPTAHAQELTGKAFGTMPDRERLRALKRAVDEGLTYIPGRVLVKWREGMPTAAKLRSISGLKGARLTNADAYADFELVEIAQDVNPEQAAATLAAQAGVEYAEPDGLRYVSFRPNDPSYSQQWNMPAINMETAWDINQGGDSDVIVAVLDTGVAFKTDVYRLQRYDGRTLHTVNVPVALANDLGPTSRFVSPFDFIWGDTDPSDFDGHGTHVAGTIGQSTNNNSGLTGVAFNVKIMPLKVCASAWDFLFLFAEEGEWQIDADFSACPDSEVAEAIRYAADHAAKVINMSFGGPGAQSRAVGDALRYAVGRGVFVAIAAGNEFEEGNPVTHPASFAPEISGVMAVAAIGRNQQRAFYSNTGPFVEITAPGGNSREGGASGMILQQTLNPSTFGVNLIAPRFDLFQEAPFQGTSMASPHVAGLAALLISQGISDPATIEEAIRHFAKDLGTPGRDNDYGYGLIDARATLRGLGLAR
jgi:serine protease